MNLKKQIVNILIKFSGMAGVFFGYIAYVFPLKVRFLLLKMSVSISHLLPTFLYNYLYLFNEFFSRVTFKFKKNEFFITKNIFNGFKIRLDITQKTQRMIFLKKEYESEIVLFLKKELENAKIFLDIGSNIGYFIVVAKAIKPDLKIIAFEPEKRNWEYLKYNVELNNLKDVTVHNMALSDSKGEQTLYLNPENEGGHRLFEFGKKDYLQQKVSVDTVDNFLKDISVDVAKIDVEGFELNVLKGGQSTFMVNDKIRIVCEISRDFEEIKEFVKNTKKDIYILNENGSTGDCVTGGNLSFSNYLIK